MMRAYASGDKLAAEDAATIRDLINDVIAGRLPNNRQQSVALRSCHDAGILGNGPAHTPGVRHFEFALLVDDAVIVTILTVTEPGSDYIRVPTDLLLGASNRIDDTLGDVDGVKWDLKASPITSANLQEHRETLAGAVNAGTSWADRLRQVADDPVSWPPIGESATVDAEVLEIFRVKGAPND